MAWQNPKTDWVVNPKNPVPEDFNRIEGNIDFLKQDIETKKGLIVDAINDMNQPAEVTDTHTQLADKIRDISDDATAAVGDVEKGKTFYSGGQKRTGTLELTGNAGTGDVLSGKTFYNTALKTKRTGAMPNRGAVIITPGTSNKAIVAGYHNGQGYVKGDANLKAANIKKGVSIFGVSGSLLSSLSVAGSGSEGAWGGPDAATFSISFPAPGILVGFAFAYKYGGRNAGDEVERTVTIDGVEVSTTTYRTPSMGYRNVGAGTRLVVCSSKDTPYAVCPAAAIGITLS